MKQPHPGASLVCGLLAATLALTSCSGGDEGSSGGSKSTSSTASGDSSGSGDSGTGVRWAENRPGGVRSSGPAEKQPIDETSLGTITGAVLYGGEPPEPREVPMGREPACQNHSSPPVFENLVVNDGGLVNVFVHLRDGYGRWEIPPAPEEAVLLDQVGCIYTPHVSALQAGQTLYVRNNDGVTHNVNSKAPRNNLSKNKSMAPGSADLEYPFDRQEMLVHFKCDLHPWMEAFVHVEEHPWFAISTEDGSFTIEDVPAGTYEIEALHEQLGKLRKTVVVEPGGVAEVDFTFEP